MKIFTKLNPMKAFFLLLVFVLTSCYVYKPYTGVEAETSNNSNSMRSTKAASIIERGQPGQPASRQRGPENPGKSVVSGDVKGQEKTEDPTHTTPQDLEIQKAKELEMKMEAEAAAKRANEEGIANVKTKEAILSELGLKQKIKANKYYKISVAEKQYKIQADQWEGDTLVAHILRKPKKVLRFHENQIDEEELLERRFSKSYSDIFTVGSYVGVGAAVLLLLL